MDIILFFFIFPIATIIFSIALQKILNNPFLVSAIILAVFLIVTFTVYGVTFLIAAFIYALIALITAYIVRLFCKIENRTIQINLINNNDDNNCNRCGCSSNNNNDLDLINQISNANNTANSNCQSNCRCNQDPDTEACRICNCQRQFRRCLRGR